LDTPFEHFVGMSLLRRAFAALSGLLLLQLTLLGSGTLCLMQTGAHARFSAHGAHGMAAMAESRSVNVARVGDARSDVPTGPANCLPVAPECSAMTTCAISAAPAATLVALAAARGVALAIAAPSPLQAGPSFAPEIPPPRV
jgi:hypothetical protein